MTMLEIERAFCEADCEVSENHQVGWECSM
jgi:hypothetical protein